MYLYSGKVLKLLWLCIYNTYILHHPQIVLSIPISKQARKRAHFSFEAHRAHIICIWWWCIHYTQQWPIQFMFVRTADFSLVFLLVLGLLWAPNALTSACWCVPIMFAWNLYVKHVLYEVRKSTGKKSVNILVTVNIHPCTRYMQHTHILLLEAKKSSRNVH